MGAPESVICGVLPWVETYGHPAAVADALSRLMCLANSSSIPAGSAKAFGPETATAFVLLRLRAFRAANVVLLLGSTPCH